jgi:hypothetical protein
MRLLTQLDAFGWAGAMIVTSAAWFLGLAMDAMCRYGGFPVLQPTSDLYLMTLAAGTYRRLPINSDCSESWHSWSSNSSWSAFSRRRQDALFTHC